MVIIFRSPPPLWRQRRTHWRQFPKIAPQQSLLWSCPGDAPTLRDACADMAPGMHVRWSGMHMHQRESGYARM